MSHAKLIGAQLGMTVFGPTGALIGGVAGAVIDAALPWGSDVFKNTIAELLASRVERVATTWMGRNNAPQVNHDLQRAFRDAVREALADMGGPTCFPRGWPAARHPHPCCGRQLVCGKAGLAGSAPPYAREATPGLRPGG